MVGELFALLALLCFATNTLLVGEGSKEVPYEWGFFIALVSQAIVGVIMVAAVLTFRRTPLVWDWTGVGLFVAGGLLSTYVGRLAMFRVIVGMGPSRASAFQILQPVFAAILAFLFLGQVLTLAEVGLLVVILAGLLVVNRSRAQREGEPATVGAGQLRHGKEGGAAVLAPPRGRLHGATLPAFRRRHAMLLVALGAGLAYGASNVLRGAAVGRWPEVLLGTAIGTMVPIGLYLWRHVRPSDLRGQLGRTSPRGLVMFGIAGLVLMVAQAAIIASMQYLPVAIANAMSVSLPIAVMPLSLIFLRNREGVTIQAAIGALVTWAAVIGFLFV